jgi:arginine-tRNA-protein transferase
MAPAAYQAFMDAGFRRSGKLVYQPTCRHCRACQPIRVPVATFAPDKSQRRCARRNADLRVSNGPPRPTGEKYELYRHYLREWHGSAKNDDDDVAGFKAFLYDSPVDTIEFEYRDGAGRLLAVGICDLCPDVLSSVYFYFDPSEAARGLGTFGALEEMAFARRTHLHYYYLGYWVPGCRAMEYKSRYRPSETLCSDGLWRPPRVP